MRIGVIPIADNYGRNYLILSIEDVVDGLSDGLSSDACGLRPGQHRLASVLLNAEIGGRLAIGYRVEPDRPTLVIHDLRPDRTEARRCRDPQLSDR